MSNSKNVPKSVGIWLLIGVFMVFIQIIIGGITRLTDSGLSITEWDVVKGVLPPLNEDEWLHAFEKYKTHAKTQFEAIHATMTLSEFKFIYFWEYFHRLWARLMGFVFLIPFIYFWFKGYLTKRLKIQLFKVVLLAATAATFGWIMVASGLDTPDYAWVNAYKLLIHLSIATALMGYLFWVTLQVLQPERLDAHNKRIRRYAWRITYIIILQIGLGALMSGMKAGLFFNHFPYMEVAPDGSWIWVADVLKEREQWSFANMASYNTNAFAPALIQLLHRTTAYLLCFLIPIYFFTIRRIQISKALKWGSRILVYILLIQVALGIFTLINCVGTIPPTLGVLHQAFGILLLLAMLFVNYQFQKSPRK